LQPELKASRQIDFLFPIIKKKKKTLTLASSCDSCEGNKISRIGKKKKKKISRIETEAAKFEAVIGNHFIRKYKIPM
jgi:hypothetical protein